MSKTETLDPFDCIDLVHSPDDDGYYLQEFHPIENKSRTSETIYKTKKEAKKDYREDSVKWGEWF